MLVMRCLRVLVGKPEENTALGKPGTDRGMILKFILKKCGGNGVDSFGSG